MKMVKVLRAGHQLTKLGNPAAALADVVQESHLFMAACYGYNDCETMTDVRIKVWKVKIAKAKIISAICRCR